MTPLRFRLNAHSVEQTFSRLIHEPWGNIDPGWVPAIDVFETEDQFLISVELPGVPLEAVHVQADGNVLTISGKRQMMQVTRSSRAISLERTQGRFVRSVSLPNPVDLDQMKLTAEHGVLQIRVPKLLTKI